MRRKVVARKSQAIAAESTLNYDSNIYNNSARSAESLVSTDQIQSDKSKNDDSSSGTPKRPSILNLIKVDNPLSPRISDAAKAVLEAASPKEVSPKEEIPASPTFESKMAVAFDYAAQKLMSTFSQRNIRVSPQSPAEPTVPMQSSENVEQVSAQVLADSRVSNNDVEKPLVEAGSIHKDTEVPPSSLPIPPQKEEEITVPMETPAESNIDVETTSTITSTAETIATPEPEPEVISKPIVESSVESPANSIPPSTTAALVAKFNWREAPRKADSTTTQPRRRTEPIVFIPPSIPDFTANENINKTVGGLAAPSMTALVRQKDEVMRQLVDTGKARRKSLADM